MARTPGQRGAFGRWLTEAREARYKTQKVALTAMRRMAGLHISASEYSQWESGSRVPRADNPKVERLYEFFGSRPEDGPTANAADGTDLAALVEVIGRQATAISELAAQVERLLDRTVRGAEGLERQDWEQGEEPAPKADDEPIAVLRIQPA